MYCAFRRFCTVQIVCYILVLLPVVLSIWPLHHMHTPILLLLLPWPIPVVVIISCLLLSLPTNHKNDKSVTVLGGGDGLTHYWFNNHDGSCQNLEASGRLEAVATGTTGAGAVPQPPPAAFGTPITNQIKRICQNTSKERRSSTGNEMEKYYVTLLRLIAIHMKLLGTLWICVHKRAADEIYSTQHLA